MIDAPPTDPNSPPAADNAAGQRIVSSETLLAGRRELIIQHGAEQYRLRLTQSNKLILVK